MLEILKYILSDFWIFCGAFSIISAVLYYLTNVIARLFRLITVALRGWPPSHLDADGDFFNED